MKKLNVFIVISIVITTLAGCDNAGFAARPAEDSCEVYYEQDMTLMESQVDAALARAEAAEKSLAEAQVMLSDADSKIAIDTGIPTEDWQARVEFCEPELLGCRQMREIDAEQYDGLYKRTTDLRDALRYFDLSDACDSGVIKSDWICDAYFSHNL